MSFAFWFGYGHDTICLAFYALLGRWVEWVAATHETLFRKHDETGGVTEWGLLVFIAALLIYYEMNGLVLVLAGLLPTAARN